MRNAFLNRDWGLYLILLLATQPVPLSSQKVTLEAGVGKQDEGMSHTGYRCSGASLHLSACPAHLTEAHALSAQRGDFSPQSCSHQEARSCTPNSPAHTFWYSG